MLDDRSATGKRRELPDLRYDERGLVPAIVQDVADGRVLMLAWMDAEALGATIATGEVHFHSRSRDRLWRKGETSGNVLRLVDLAADCDNDTLLMTVEPVGPTCHRGTRSCFDPAGEPVTRAGAAERAGPAGVAEPGEPDGAAEPGEPAEPSTQGFAWLESLWTTIVSRAAARPEGSYTARLLAGGVDAVSRKVTEEATEVLIAAKDDAAAENAGADRAATGEALTGEAADLIYHTMVLLQERGLEPSSVVKVLRERHAG
jgi:phosphoribosyl-ATP pyrophosphohydrolase/phosphoribosyl-AMP cyclohydrolase